VPEWAPCQENLSGQRRSCSPDGPPVQSVHQPIFPGSAEVARRMARRYHPFINPEDVGAAPYFFFKTGFCGKEPVHGPGGGPAGNSHPKRAFLIYTSVGRQAEYFRPLLRYLFGIFGNNDFRFDVHDICFLYGLSIKIAPTSRVMTFWSRR